MTWLAAHWALPAWTLVVAVFLLTFPRRGSGGGVCGRRRDDDRHTPKYQGVTPTDVLVGADGSTPIIDAVTGLPLRKPVSE